MTLHGACMSMRGAVRADQARMTRRLSMTLDVATRLRYSVGMSKSDRQRLEQLRREAISQGWRIIDHGGHTKWLPPDPSAGFVTVAGTPSDPRAIRNIESELRRKGLNIPRKGG